VGGVVRPARRISLGRRIVERKASSIRSDSSREISQGIDWSLVFDLICSASALDPVGGRSGREGTSKRDGYWWSYMLETTRDLWVGGFGYGKG